MLRRARDRFIAGPAASSPPTPPRPIEDFTPDVVVADAFLSGRSSPPRPIGVARGVARANIWMMPIPRDPAIGPGFAPASTVFGRRRDAAIGGASQSLFHGPGCRPSTRPDAEYGSDPLSSFYEQALGADRSSCSAVRPSITPSRSVPGQRSLYGPILDDPNGWQPWISPWSDAQRAATSPGGLQFHLPEPGTGPAPRRRRPCRTCPCTPS